MKPKIIFIILLLAVICQSFNKSHSNTLAKCFIFPSDTLAFNDTLRLNDTLAIVKHRLMITDTFVNRVVVDNTWLNKTSSITDYIISPNDTIIWQSHFGHKPYMLPSPSGKMAKTRVATKKKNVKVAKNDFLVEMKEEQTCDECEDERLAAIAAEKKEQEEQQVLCSAHRSWAENQQCLCQYRPASAKRRA